MATFYILYSATIDKHYIGSCKNLEERLNEHNHGLIKHSFTKQANDWIIKYSKSKLEYQQVRNIESHVKSMKSRKYIENLIKYPEMMEKLMAKYGEGSSR